MNQDLYSKVSGALQNTPSKQPFHANVKVDEKPDNGKKANSKAGMGNTKLKNRNAFNPHRSYAVEVVNKAKARMG